MAGTNGRDPESHGTVRNVVVVVFDTARAVSVNPETTPTLCELGASGTTVENAFAAAPWTLPSHASIFTGTYPSEHGTHGGNLHLDSSLRTLPEAFADAGYETVGISNNTWITEEFGFDRGFDELRKGWQYLQSDADMGAVVRGEDLREKLAATRRRLFDGNPVVNAANILYSEVFQPAGDDGAARTTEWVTDWLRTREADRPFFLFCNYIEPHVEYDPPQEYAERFLPDDASYEDATAIRQDPRAYDCDDYEITDREFDLLRGLYRAELAYVDDQLGALRTALEDASEWGETLFVVCGDHGEHVGEHGFFGHQYNLYDTLLHVPLVIHGGPFTDGGRRTDLVQLLDLPETLLETAGIEDQPLRDQSSGQSLHPDASHSEREAVFAEYVTPQPSIERLEARFGELPDRVYEFDRQLRAVRTSDYKYVCGDDGFERLHRISSDPDERVDVADGEPEAVRELRARIEERFGTFDRITAGDATAGMREGTKERLADLGYL
ncbi:sulfatase [Natrarchaeobaculum aegyptiacum]|uniref:Sulfatase n=1 Tax=Natrarchaeobaculum aegyptiacum TaxID=745377 RepID=A0A2Z2HVH7_9EURY|nr:sulfatase [Natrarchaeobaculum aegyptiacum]ARS91221.1 sulfatase [Natrarchaeobaculum aegyptiacum]